VAAKLDKLLKKARALRDKGKLERALKQYRSACAEPDSGAEVWSERAEVAERAGEIEEAVSALYRAADVCARSGERDQAVRLAERVLRLEPEHEGARGIAGRPSTESELDEVEEVAQEPEANVAGEQESAPHRESDRASEDDSEPDSELKSESDSEAENESEGEPEAGAEAAAEAQSDVDAEAESVPEPEPEPEPESEPDAAVPTAMNAATSGKLALHDISIVAGATDAPAELILDIAEPGGKSVRAATAAVGGSSRLCELDSDLVARLIDCGSLLYRRAQKAVFMQGEVGDSLFLVLQGELAVERAEGERGAIERIATLRSGALFGEMSVLTDSPRTATVRAERDSTLIEVSRDTLQKLLRDDDRLLVLLVRFYRARLVGNLMASSPLFESLSKEDREDLLAKFQLREYPEGYEILREGERSDGLYVVLAGDIAAMGPEEPKVLGRLGPGDVFGEMSLLAGGDTTSASVQAETRSWVLELPGDVFRALADAHPAVRESLEAIAVERARDNRTRDELVLAAFRPV
jgi:CRP-like cAMP-binding protein